MNRRIPKPTPRGVPGGPLWANALTKATSYHTVGRGRPSPSAVGVGDDVAGPGFAQPVVGTGVARVDDDQAPLAKPLTVAVKADPDPAARPALTAGDDRVCHRLPPRQARERTGRRNGAAPDAERTRRRAAADSETGVSQASIAFDL